MKRNLIKQAEENMKRDIFQGGSLITFIYYRNDAIEIHT